MRFSRAVPAEKLLLKLLQPFLYLFAAFFLIAVYPSGHPGAQVETRSMEGPFAASPDAENAPPPDNENKYLAGETGHAAPDEPDAGRPLPHVLKSKVMDEGQGTEGDASPEITPLPRKGTLTGPMNWAPPDITRGESRRMELSITFDGGYESGDAQAILKVLRERGIKTTIFLTGMFIRQYPWIVKEIVRDGHEVGNHTMTHPHLTDYANSYTQKTLPNVTRDLVSNELSQAAALFRSVTGREMAPLWRAPYGEVNDTIRRWAYEEGYIHIGWTCDHRRKESLDTLDWVANRSSRLYLSPPEIKARVLGFGRDAGGVRGGIILMHLGTERKEDKAVGILGEMIDGVMSMGYRFVPVSRLMEGDRNLEAVAKKERAVESAAREERIFRDAGFTTAKYPLERTGALR